MIFWSFCHLISSTFAYLLIDVIVGLFVKLSRLLRVLLFKVTFVENQFQKSFPNRKREKFLHYWSCWLTQFPKWLSDIFSNDHICHLHANLQQAQTCNSNGYIHTHERLELLTVLSLRKFTNASCRIEGESTI